MAPTKEKKKLSKQAKKKMMKERSKKALEKRLGIGSRRKFALAANWKEEKYKSGDKSRVKFVSPGKTVYKTQKAVGKALVARNLTDCFYESKSTTEDENTGSDTDYELDFCKETSCNKSETTPPPGLEIERRFFICESTQLMDMVHQINSTSKC